MGRYQSGQMGQTVNLLASAYGGSNPPRRIKTMKNFKEQPKIERKIDKARIPDEDVSGWMQTLREGGFSNEEIDLMLGGLNQEYAEQKLPKEIRESWNRVVKTVEEKRGLKMSEEEKEELFYGYLDVVKHHYKKGEKDK